MNWAQLAVEIANLTDEQRNTDVTIYIPGMDEFYATKERFFITTEDDVLNKNHPYLSL
jgi:hypothetical protein